MSEIPRAEHEPGPHSPAGPAVLPQEDPAHRVAPTAHARRRTGGAAVATRDHAAPQREGRTLVGMDHATQSAMDHATMPGMDHATMPGMVHTAVPSGGMNHDMSDPAMAQAMETDIRTRFFVALGPTLPVILYAPLGQSLLQRTLPTPLPVTWLLFLLTTPIVFWAGWLFVGGAFRALRARTLDMSVLIATGVLTAYLFSAYLTVTGGTDTFIDAAAMLVTFVLFGHWMEMRARKGTTESLRALFDQVPPQATVIRAGQEVQVDTATVVVGDLLRIRPGDKFPVDGTVTQRATTINETLVTGERLPMAKGPGDAVIGRSLNQAGSIVMQATRVGADTTIGQIAGLVRTAQNSKAPGQRLVDKAATVLVLVAVGSGLVTFLAWTISGVPTIMALTFAISAVVIACPDALGLATPTAIGAGTDVAIETANIVLMKSDPLDIVRALILSSATVTKMKQNLFWASIYNVPAIPIAAGLFYTSLGWQIRPEIAALLMSVSSIIVAVNAVLLRRVEGKLTHPGLAP